MPITRGRITPSGVKPSQVQKPGYQNFYLYGAVEPAAGERFFLDRSALNSDCSQQRGVSEPVLIYVLGLRAASMGWGRRSCPWCKSSPIYWRQSGFALVSARSSPTGMTSLALSPHYDPRSWFDFRRTAARSRHPVQNQNRFSDGGESSLNSLFEGVPRSEKKKGRRFFDPWPL